MMKHVLLRKNIMFLYRHKRRIWERFGQKNNQNMVSPLVNNVWYSKWCHHWSKICTNCISITWHYKNHLLVICDIQSDITTWDAFSSSISSYCMWKVPFHICWRYAWVINLTIDHLFKKL
jgi:hypothetical protein